MASLDGLTLHRQVNELKRLLTGGKIDKISQPDSDEIILSVRSQGENFRLLVSAAPDSCRIHISDIKKQNPIEAPMFCMLLRKHLTGGRIISIDQPLTDRIVRIVTENTDELYNTNRFILCCELMGRHSNIILINSDGIIAGSIKRVGLSMSQARIVMPGVKYEEPPTEKKQDPLVTSVADVEKVLENPGRIDRLMSGAYYGVAPVVCTFVTPYAAEHSENLTPELRKAVAASFYDTFTKVRDGETVYLASCGEKEQFMPFEPHEGEYREFISPSSMLEEYYRERDLREYMRRRAYSLTHAVEQKQQRAQKKLAAFEQAIASEGDYDKYRIYGELITANLHKIKAGQRSVFVDNYYEMPPVPTEIALDAALSPAKNAQRYFKLYKKAKGARDTALAMRDEVSAESEYLASVLDLITRADSTDTLDAIRAELEDMKIIRPDKKRQKKQKKLPPIRTISSDGFEILTGRNNYQNDELTFRIASSFDTWLHVKNRPGSHTVILNPDRKELPDTTLYEAACVAAKNSSAGESGAKVEVDYTLCRCVKKPAGSPPGKVIYTNQKTILAIPQGDGDVE